MLTKLSLSGLVLFAGFAAAQNTGQNQTGLTPGLPAPSAAAYGPVTTNTGAPNTTTTQHPGYDPLLDLPPLPSGKVTLIGGTVVRLDEVMNRMVVQPFGGKQRMKVGLDTRTHFIRDGKPITEKDVKEGQRVYLDTMLNGDRVFAKTIWIQTSTENGFSHGQIIRFDPRDNTLTVRDELSSQPVKMQLSSGTVIKRGEQTVQSSDLVEGALVALAFGPQHEVHEITLLAMPGTTFTFAGRVTYLDLSRKLIAIDNHSDGKTYDVYMEAVAPNVLRQLHEGVNVSVTAVFDGTRYAARSVDLQSSGRAEGPQ